MKTIFGSVLLWASLLIAFAAGPGTLNSTPQSNSQPALVHTCLITRNIRALAAFYATILEIKPSWSGEDYVEFRSTVGTLAIFSYSAQQQYIPDITEPASSRGVILEFRVPDVDHEYARLQPLVKTWVKPPTTQPWATRSIYFRDPDGNLLNFFTESQKP